MPQKDYTFPEDTVRAGDLVDGNVALQRFRSYSYDQVADTYTLVFGGTETDGVYSLTVNGVTVSITRSTTPASNADLAAAFATAGEAVALLHQVASFSANSATVTITALTKGIKLAVADVTAPAPGTLTLTNTVDSDQSDIPPGIVVSSDDGLSLRLPASGDTEDSFAGALMLSEPLLRPRSFDSLSTEVDGYPQGQILPVGGDGEYVDVYLHAETAMTRGAEPYVRCIATGTETAGYIRSSADGTAQVTTATPTALDDQEHVLQIHFTAGPAKGETHVISSGVIPATSTATLVCNGFRTAIASNARLAALITASGTATLILTAADAASIFEVEDVGFGEFASITTGTPGAPDSVQWSKARVLETTSAAGLCPVRIRR